MFLGLISAESRGVDEETGKQLYLLPDTREIEASYREAVTDHGLPTLTAVDSLFSVMDWNLERSLEPQYVLARTAGAADLSWGQMLEPELEAGRTVYDSEVFLDDNISPFKESFGTITALLQQAYACTGNTGRLRCA